jgi:plastocyanin
VAFLMVAGGTAVAYSPPSVGDSATPAPASGFYAGDGRVAKDAPWHVDGLDFFFEGVPPSNHPGVKPVTFHNRSDHEEHEIVVFKLADKNATVEQAVAAANQFGEHGLIDGGFATAELGELKIGPDSELAGEFNFAEPGAYVYYCFIDTHGGHWNYGMVGKILISEPAAPAPPA